MEKLRQLGHISKNCILIACTYYTLRHNVADVWILSEDSMKPTLLDGQIVLTVPFDTVKRGDVVIARSPADPKIRICKRVLGLKGDIKQYGNNSNFEKSYVPEGQVWLEGDNSSVSRDSRTYGPVPLGLIEGKIVWRVFPFSFSQQFLELKAESSVEEGKRE